jgi:hypothetical protein
VSRFIDNAMQILNAAETAAETAAESGHTPSDMTILMTPQGIRMIADSDWPLESLQLQHGAEMAYRVSRSAIIVRVEGRAGSRTCLFETEKPEQTARTLLNATPVCHWMAPQLAAASEAGVAQELR